MFSGMMHTNSLPAQNILNARIRVNAYESGELIDGRLWGSNVTNESRTMDHTVRNPAFAAAARQMGIRVIRWPGGNNADAYDWKRNEMIKPGRRLSWDGSITLPEIAAFCREIGAELSITVNFGTMTPGDAADLVEYCNGPATSRWGSVRASQGFPEPLNVQFFEIGNEINQPHQWFNSWTAENPYKYFFGGDEERRGDYFASPNLDPVGKKGDFFKATGGSGQVYVLRFPPVRNVQVAWAATKEEASNGDFVKWQQVADLRQHGPDAKVFVLDSLSGTLTFGDDVHGAAPPQGSFFLVEYSTTGRKGFVDFARAMRQVPSSVPIKIGAVTTPFIKQKPITTPDSLRMIFEEMDFWISHQYGASFPTDTYTRRRQMAFERTRGTVIGRMQQAVDSLGIEKTLGVGVTEWNIYLDEADWQLNRTLEAAVITGEYFIRVLNAQPGLPVWVAHQFALHGVWLALYNTWTSFSIAPMGYVFEGFKPWKGTQRLPVEVDSPVELAYDQELPFINAAAARTVGGDTLMIAITNSSENQALVCRLEVSGFDYGSGRLLRLEGDSPLAHNDGGDPLNVALQEQRLAAGEADSLPVPPHSVLFVELYRGATTSVSEAAAPPGEFVLWQNYPNPFNPETAIRYRLSAANDVELTIFDLTGRRVRTLVRGRQNAGAHTVTWDGRDARGQAVASGVYLYRLVGGGQVQVRRMVVIR